jgi:hypothetical protein
MRDCADETQNGKILHRKNKIVKLNLEGFIVIEFGVR